MKKILNISLIALMALLFVGCQELTTEGVTRITYYADIQLQGDATIVHQKGTQFEDPGFVAVLNGEDVSSQVNVSSNVDVNKSGVYTVSYAFTNEDGFTASAKRSVIVLDLTDPVEGFYLTDPNSYRLNSAGAKTAWGAEFELLVTSNGDGTYEFDDLLGGYYCQRAGYGSAYAMPGTVSIADDGTMELVAGGGVAGWGDAYDAFSGSFDAASSTFTFTTSYAGMDFNVIMTKE